MAYTLTVWFLPSALWWGCPEYDIVDPHEEPPPEPVPELSVEPREHQFVDWCPQDRTVTLRNVGTADLTLFDVALTPEPFTVLTLEHELPLPLTLEPGEHAAVTVQHTPEGVGEAEAFLRVDSDDPEGLRWATLSSSVTSRTVRDSHEVSEDPPADILFAIDKSCSMRHEAYALGVALADFVDRVDEVTADWRLGAVTRDDGCFNVGVLEPDWPHVEDVFVDAATDAVGPPAELAEKLFEMTDNALALVDPGECNHGFLRPGAVVHLVTVSDEDEQSGISGATWLTRWAEQVGDARRITLSAVVDTSPKGDCGTHGAAYADAATAADGLVLDVCDKDWGQQMVALGDRTAETLHSYLLSALPIDGTLRIELDGTQLDDGWTYDPARNAVRFDTPPKPGTTVWITYEVGSCDL
ncbi:MAG: hypothetical protein KTR31_17760 [Myxococcales bacterium]|nr:hypothetical protein [Myxococcales bacterium]